MSAKFISISDKLIEMGFTKTLSEKEVLEFKIFNDFDVYKIILYDNNIPFISISECFEEQEEVIVRKFKIKKLSDIRFLFERIGGGISRLK